MGVRVYGKAANAWVNPEERLIGPYAAVFDSDVYIPDTSFDHSHFVLPCHRGKKDYNIHLLESGEAVVFKEGCAYLCTHRDGTPRVLTFEPVPADKEEVLAR